jgi:3'-phosphoadenosine 5'-phosphosulfate (PAPS) 3'-phosphatase
MTRTYTEMVTLQEDTCCVCGIIFAAPEHWFASKRSTGATFYCPNGHTLSFAKGTEQLLRDKIADAEKREKDLELQLISAKDQLQATKRELTKQKKRIANGVCPCCHRSFVKLQQHMKSQHPNYA